MNIFTFQVWHANLCVRGWRESILNEAKYRLDEDFITTPTYWCIEINAHSLVNFYMYCRNSGNFNLFRGIVRINSQCCEKLYRYLRSMHVLKSTSINMSLRDSLYKTRRIQVIDELEFRMHGKCEYFNYVWNLLKN